MLPAVLHTEFPLIDMCLKDSIRLQLCGTAFRKNMSGQDIPLNKAGTEVVPKDAFVTYAMGDVHYNPRIYKNPDDWDPSRYMPGRAEDKKEQYAWVGWGVVSCMIFFSDSALIGAGSPSMSRHAICKAREQFYCGLFPRLLR